MDNKKVTVLTPHGRRQTISISPSTTILEILETVCKKHGFSSSEYDLKHHNTVLDSTIMFQFSGLPNNCLLEMIELSRKRNPKKDVILCVQLEDGSRRQGTFQQSENLLHILQNLCPEKLESGKNPVFIYMRKEIFGNELSQTSLKNLGITGRAIVRLLDRTPEELKKQANVSVPIVHNKEKANLPAQTRPLDHETAVKPKAKPASHFFELTTDKLKSKNLTKDMPANQKQKSDDLVGTNEPNPNKKNEYDWGSGGRTIKGNDTDEGNSELIELQDEEMFEEPQIIELGDRNAVIFSLAQAQKVADEIPDSFFDLTVEDLKLILRDLKAQASESDEPLLTSKLREIQEQSKMLRKMDKYKKSVIRIQFPDRLVLQGTFKSTDKLQDVYDFVKQYLEDSNLDFHLYTTPPKNIPDIEKTLIELDFIPTIILHFGVSTDQSKENFLKPEFLTKLSSPDGATLAASKLRGKCSRTIKLSSRSSRPQQSGDQPQSPKGAVPKKPKPDSFRQSSSAVSTSSGQIPKWFKNIKK